VRLQPVDSYLVTTPSFSPFSFSGRLERPAPPFRISSPFVCCLELLCFSQTGFPVSAGFFFLLSGIGSCLSPFSSPLIPFLFYFDAGSRHFFTPSPFLFIRFLPDRSFSFSQSPAPAFGLFCARSPPFRSSLLGGAHSPLFTPPILRAHSISPLSLFLPKFPFFALC